MGRSATFIALVLALSSTFGANSLRISKSAKKNGELCPMQLTGLTPNPDDCHSFYNCNGGIPGLIHCPENLCYNPVSTSCDYCWNVPGCENGDGPPEAPSSTSAPPTSSAAPSTTVAPSSAYPSTTSPAPSSAAPSTTTTERNEGGDLPCPNDPYIYMAHPDSCNKFYYCVDGVNVGTWNCASGLWFHFGQQACNFPWGNSCK